ncbi:MAG: metallophosphoesterase [Clostridia bacterium]|nr:metallophosphoesterase [Clostridia bacterium]
MELNRIRLESARISAPVKFLFLSDLHDRPAPQALELLKQEKMDFIAFTGDAVNRHSGTAEQSLRFLEEAAKLCPVFFSVGNHENALPDMPWERLAAAGVAVLDNAETEIAGLRVGGLSSWLKAEEKKPAARRFAENFSRDDGKFRLLLCHHPEYYPLFLRDLELDLILSGHAHGGQIRILGQGLYAPGQGILPRYTAGLHDGRLLISRGMANHTVIPRLFNPPEMLVVEIG